jgi:hypothetical protein
MALDIDLSPDSGGGNIGLPPVRRAHVVACETDRIWRAIRTAPRLQELHFQEVAPPCRHALRVGPRRLLQELTGLQALRAVACGAGERPLRVAATDPAPDAVVDMNPPPRALSPGAVMPAAATPGGDFSATSRRSALRVLDLSRSTLDCALPDLFAVLPTAAPALRELVLADTRLCHGWRHSVGVYAAAMAGALAPLSHLTAFDCRWTVARRQAELELGDRTDQGKQLAAACSRGVLPTTCARCASATRAHLCALSSRQHCFA